MKLSEIISLNQNLIIANSLDLSGEAALKIAKCLRDHEPELWEMLKSEMGDFVESNDPLNGKTQKIQREILQELFEETIGVMPEYIPGIIKEKIESIGKPI